MVTYNQEAYLAQAIEGVLNQEVDVPIELVVGEDHAPGRTLEVALGYQRRHPSIVRVLTGERNVGMHRNFRDVFDACRGDYVALCDGDDYWTAPDKLMRQLRIL